MKQRKSTSTAGLALPMDRVHAAERLLLSALCVAALALSAAQALASEELVMPPFVEVDPDGDQFLSIEEAQAAFPTLMLSDSDDNGYLDKHEAEAALPGLAWTDDTHEDGEARVGAFEYTLMAERYLQALHEVLEE